MEFERVAMVTGLKLCTMAMHMGRALAAILINLEHV